MIANQSIQSYKSQKISVLRVFENKGAETALRLYPDFEAFILFLQTLTPDQLAKARNVILVDFKKLKDSH